MRGLHIRKVPYKLRSDYLNKLGLFVLTFWAIHMVFGIPVDSISVLYTVLFADWHWWHHHDKR